MQKYLFLGVSLFASFYVLTASAQPFTKEIEAKELSGSNRALCAGERPSLVPNERVAKNIYEAIVREVFPGRMPSRVSATDEGKTWSVGSAPEDSHKKVKDKTGRLVDDVTVVFGGGGVEMTIDKCTASVRVHFAR